MLSPDLQAPSQLKWYCLKCQPRMEPLVAANLRKLQDVEVFFPQTVITKKTAEGKRVIRKPLFPGYLFTSFDPVHSMRTVHYCQGVSYIVRHGLEPVEVPPEIVSDLFSMTTEEGVLEVPAAPLEVGQTVRVLHGLFEGSEGKVLKLIPAQKRVQLLLSSFVIGKDPTGIVGQPMQALSRVEIGEDLVDGGESHPLGSEANPLT